MKICMISFHSCPYSSLGGNGSGGMSVYLRELTARLVDSPDVCVDILTRAQDPVCMETKDISPQIRVVQLKGGPEHPVDRKNLYDFIPEFSENLEDYIHRKKEDYDIIHSHYWLSGLAGLYIKSRLGMPHVHTYHTLSKGHHSSLTQVAPVLHTLDTSFHIPRHPEELPTPGPPVPYSTNGWLVQLVRSICECTLIILLLTGLVDVTVTTTLHSI